MPASAAMICGYCAPGLGFIWYTAGLATLPSKGKIERVWRTLRGQLLERLDLERVTTIDEFNLRLWTWSRPSTTTSRILHCRGRTPPGSVGRRAAQIRWVEDHQQLETDFYGEASDSSATIQNRAVAPASSMRSRLNLRRQRVRLRYALLDSTRVSVLDGGTEIPIRRVQPVDNAYRSRALPARRRSPAIPLKPGSTRPN